MPRRARRRPWRSAPVEPELAHLDPTARVYVRTLRQAVATEPQVAPLPEYLENLELARTQVGFRLKNMQQHAPAAFRFVMDEDSKRKWPLAAGAKENRCFVQRS